MSHRDTFLARVRQAAEQGRRHRVHVRTIPEGIGYLGAGEDLCQHFAAEVATVGGQAFVVSDWGAAGEQLDKLLLEAGAKSAICWQHEVLERAGAAEVCRRLNVAVLDYASLLTLTDDARRRALFGCDVGITSCDFAIAETGTLMMCSSAGQERVASLVAPLHIAIVERRQIVPDLIDAVRLLGERGSDGLPRNVTFITGPSKTGDIELQLTTGVHGPGKWRVIVVDA